ncbi:MAG: hypothetical protein GTO02_18080, partial [Candidatus Dadabacteria bacterium]|nr:hypothetical protein [Candidatus Dadabacteria bacterium]NIQ16223.1 hypothetical protein [Candidatus Dadabacteria bacterium]
MKKYLLLPKCSVLAMVINAIILTELTAFGDELSSIIKKGDKYYNDFNNLSALQEYSKAFNIDPESFEILMKLTRAYNDVGEDYKEQGSELAESYFFYAFDYAVKMQDLFPLRAETYFYLAASRGNLALYKGGKDKVKLGRDVEKYAKKAIELKPDYGEPHVALGVFYR